MITKDPNIRSSRDRNACMPNNPPQYMPFAALCELQRQEHNASKRRDDQERGAYSSIWTVLALKSPPGAAVLL